MRYPRRIRFLAALVALVSLLFTQLALAGYDCPEVARALEQSVAMHDAYQDCCSPHDKQSPNLCQAHGQSKSQSLDLPAQPPVPPFVPASLMLAVSSVETPLPLNLEAPASFLETASSSPPIAIRNCCLRN